MNVERIMPPNALGVGANSPLSFAQKVQNSVFVEFSENSCDTTQEQIAKFCSVSTLLNFEHRGRGKKSVKCELFISMNVIFAVFTDMNNETYIAMNDKQII